jgi:hypothetical protein
VSGIATGVIEPVGTATPADKGKKAKVPVPRWKTVVKAIWRRAKAFAFVVAAFAFWFLFVSLAKFVMRCEVTAWFALPPEYRCAQTNLGWITQKGGWADTVILLATLAIAIWAAKRLVFPPDD